LGWLALYSFVGLLALTGGASRFDAVQIVPLRALSAAYLVFSMMFINREGVRSERALFVLFLGFVLVVAIQLAPLPPSVTENLAGRINAARIAGAVGTEDNWRPLTLAPMRTWNAFASLVVPAAGLFLATSLNASSITLLRMIVALGVVNALLGLLQILAGRSSFLYLYEVTNRGSPVGIFANENHSAIFGACSILAVAALWGKVREGRGHAWERVAYPMAFLLMVVVALVGGSRAGFAALIGAVLISTVLVASARPMRRARSSRRGALPEWLSNRPRILMAAPILALLLIVGSFVALGRAPGFTEVYSKDSFAELRWILWPVLYDMVRAHWLAGAGFGSFEQVYHIYEPTSLLMPQYVNQAHNDWAQLVIEGGILSVALLAALLAWVAKAIAEIYSSGKDRMRPLFWISIFGILGFASLVDYPLRTPTFQVVAVWFLIVLSRERRGLIADRSSR